MDDASRLLAQSQAATRADRTRALSYLEYDGGWSVGSWSITEPSTGYQAKYVLALSALAR